MKPRPISVALISTFPPTQCGIATYSADLTEAYNQYSDLITVTKINLLSESDNDNRKGHVIQKENANDYFRLLPVLNSPDIDIVDIQHEFKIYGSPSGENITILLDNIKKPICTTLHTVSPLLNEKRTELFKKIVDRSDLLYVFSHEAKTYINETFKKSNNSITVIPHGVPRVVFKSSSENILRNNYKCSLLFISSGHMRDAKGYETAIIALSKIKKQIPDFIYLILGADHPANEFAISYRQSLIELINQLELKENIKFINSYLDINTLVEYIQAADICLLPYTRKDQSSSGVLSLMIACGRPVVSTPFQFAKTVVSESSGVLASSFDSTDFETGILKLLERKIEWKAINYYNYHTGLHWAWDKVSKHYMQGYTTLLK